MKLPLFPLKTVLLPGCNLPLKIFEARYSDMIASCLRENTTFGVVLIYEGEETDNDVKVYTSGTSARITDWQNREDGLLGITVIGEQRFHVNSTTTSTNGLIIADIDYLEEDAEQEIPDQFYYMRELLQHISNHKDDDHLPEDFSSIVYRLVYLLPLDNSLKQQLLEVPHCMDRAVVLHAELIRLGVIQYVKPGLG